MLQVHQCVFIFIGLMLSVSVKAAPDTVPLAGEQLHRNALIREILDRNPGIEALQAAETAAIARIEPAGSLDDPMLSYGISPLQFGGNGQPDRSYQLEISQTLPWPGKLADRAESVRAQSRVADADIEILKIKLRELAASAYAEWAFVESALDINASHQRLLMELRSTAESQYAAGYGAQQDVLQANIEQQILENRALELERQRAELRARINGLLNRDPDDPLPASSGLTKPERPRPYQALAQLARTSHPELIRIEHQIGGYEARLKLAEKEFYPDFRVSAGYNSMWGDPRHRPVIGVSINVPLDQSKRQAALSAAKADLKETEWRLVDRRSQLLAELKSAHAAVLESLQSFELYRDRLAPLSKDVLDAAVADYTAGRSDFLSIISAERHKLTTELGQARALADYHRQLARLESAVSQPLATSHPQTAMSVTDVLSITTEGLNNE